MLEIMVRIYLSIAGAVAVTSGAVFILAKVLSKRDKDNKEIEEMKISDIIKNSILLGIIWPKLLYGILE